MKKPRHWLLDYSVYLAVRIVVALCQALSIRQSYALADFVAAVMYRVDKRHRLVAMDNLKEAFGDRYTEPQRDALVREVYRHFCRMLMDMLHIPRKLRLTNYRQHIRLDHHAGVLESLLEGGPVILLSGHFGNWEMAGYLFGVFGFPSYAVARTLDNPYLDRFLRRFRERTGQHLIDKNSGYDDMLNVLRRGEVLSFLADQDAGARGLFVDFFGRPASTHKAIALLAIEYNAPVVVGTATRIGDFRYEVRCEDLIQPADWQNQPDPIKFITQRYTLALEQAVRRTPEQYLWLHRRWKNQPRPRKTPQPHFNSMSRSTLIS